MTKETVINELNDLLTRNYDAEKGYINIQNETTDPQLRAFFREKIANRYQFGHQIKDLIRAYGGEPDKGGSLKGKLHRTWIDIKANMTNDDPEALLEEIERGEESFLETYEDMLENKDLPSDVRRVIQRQYHSARITLNRVEKLEDIYDND